MTAGEGMRSIDRMAQLDARPCAAVPLVDGEPGEECQVDFGRLGLVFDSATGRPRVCHALVFTACVSRHCWCG